MFFASDNAGPVHPDVMARLATANQGYAMPYGNDPIMETVRGQIRTLFEAPEAEVLLVLTGTAANSLALSLYCQPWQTTFCSAVAHIHEDECNAPEFFMGGAKLTIVPTADKMTPAALCASISGEETRGVHGPQRGPVSITTVTERGSVYSLDELRALTAIARDFKLPVHLDGARFANAIAALGCTPAEMTWKSGIDVLSFGGTKNGLMGVEAVVMFDPSKKWELELRRKRAAQLMSKGRYLSAQMNAYLTDDLWLRTARTANANCTYLAAALRGLPNVSLKHQPDANIIFADMTRATHQRLHAAGAVYYVMGGDHTTGDPDEMLPARMVCDWAMTHDLIDRFIAHAAG